MEIRRTANAGVLLQLDGVKILLDGVCREVKPYSATPPDERILLETQWPDIIAFTHNHLDHYDPVYAAKFQKQTNGVVLGPQGLEGVSVTDGLVQVGGVKVTQIPSRHIGVAGKTTAHVSFVMEGSRCVWFMGDSAPLQWKSSDLPKPDVIIAPYAYANTMASWQMVQAFDPQTVVLLHLPKRELDTVGLYNSVATITNLSKKLLIPKMGQVIKI